MVEWIDYSQNIPLSKVRQEHSAIKDSGELLNAVLAVGVAGHFPPDSCNAMLLPLHQLTLALNFIILEFSFSFNLRPHQCPHPLTVCHSPTLTLQRKISLFSMFFVSETADNQFCVCR
jgi:hypothetical protein